MLKIWIVYPWGWSRHQAINEDLYTHPKDSYCGMQSHNPSIPGFDPGTYNTHKKMCARTAGSQVWNAKKHLKHIDLKENHRWRWADSQQSAALC